VKNNKVTAPLADVDHVVVLRGRHRTYKALRGPSRARTSRARISHAKISHAKINLVRITNVEISRGTNNRVASGVRVMNSLEALRYLW
jgi:hypothetical protein